MLTERDQLILNNRKLVYKIISTHFKDKIIFPLEYVDLVSAGYVGLVEAVNSYKEETKVPLSSWLSMNIYWRVADELRAAGWVDSHSFRDVREFMKLYGDMTELTTQDIIRISQETGKTEQEVIDIINLFKSGIVSCSESIIDLLDNLDFCTIDYIEQYILIHNLLERLSHPEFYIIKSVFFDDKSYTDISKEMDIPTAIIGAKVKEILNKMRAWCKDDYEK